MRMRSGKETAMRTVCLMARRRLGEALPDVVPNQAEILFEGRLLQLSKAYAPWVKLREF
jgi:hypothetical protein